jgi:glutamate-1-semialdehyde 2,1-aminomutase
VIVEPIAANNGLVPPAPGFLEGLRRECDRVGALLIFDEVITGFRVARGGAQELLHVQPDLSTFGKVIGGGLPIGAYGGRAEVMACIAPLGPVYQAGTLSGNPVATAAGLAALELLTPDVYRELDARTNELSLGLAKAFAGGGVDATLHPFCGLIGVAFGEYVEAPFGATRTIDEAAYARVFHAMLAQGIAMAPGAYEVMFVGMAHEDAVIEEILEAAERAFTGMG